MKKCSYCGKEYPDTATACAIDGEALVNSSATSNLLELRQKMTGVWRGVYGYVATPDRPQKPSAAFTLKLKQGWFAHFTGSVTDDAPQGVPGLGTIDGFFNSPAVKFIKQQPVGYIQSGDRRMTLREHIVAAGYECLRELPGTPITYKGTFLDANRMQGIWSIAARRIPLPDGKSVNTAEASGYWCAEFITGDLKANPAGGPTQPFYDRSLLPALEMDQGRTLVFRRLGSFSPAEAGALLPKLQQAGLRVEAIPEADLLEQANPFPGITGGLSEPARRTEFFVHPEDEPKARKILSESGILTVNDPLLADSAFTQSTPVPPFSTKTDPAEDTPAGYACLARLEPMEAKRLLLRLEEAGIPFQIDNGESRYETARGLRKNMFIEIFVPLAKLEQAGQIYSADWKV